MKAHYILILMATCFQGCSDNPVSIENDSWSCNKINSVNSCLVEFDIQRNKGNFPVDVEIRIRAHRQSGSAGSLEGIRNDVVENKEIRLKMESNERVHFSETLDVKSRVTNIVVSAWASK